MNVCSLLSFVGSQVSQVSQVSGKMGNAEWMDGSMDVDGAEWMTVNEFEVKAMQLPFVKAMQ